LIDSSISTATDQNEVINAQVDDGSSIDRTAAAYALLNEVLDNSVIEEPTTSSSNKSSIKTTMTNPTGHIPSPSLNASLDSSLSSVTSIDAGSHLGYFQK
jgi:hypothetical protein